MLKKEKKKLDRCSKDLIFDHLDLGKQEHSCFKVPILKKSWSWRRLNLVLPQIFYS